MCTSVHRGEFDCLIRRIYTAKGTKCFLGH